jgi:hypothetical protein
MKWNQPLKIGEGDSGISKGQSENVLEPTNKVDKSLRKIRCLPLFCPEMKIFMLKIAIVLLSLELSSTLIISLMFEREPNLNI